MQSHLSGLACSKGVDAGKVQSLPALVDAL